jgi:predicted nucleotidyltransferase
MTSAIQKTIEEATQRLVAEFQPEQVWLFGSYAWGEPNKDSDLDLLVVVPESKERPLSLMQRASWCLRGLGMASDVLVKTKPEFDRVRTLSPTLTHKIVAEGRLLYG